VVTPERIKHLFERTELFMALDEEGATGVKDFVARLDVDVREGLCEIEDATDGDVEADAAQQATEDD
jgi:hypothetical protein